MRGFIKFLGSPVVPFYPFSFWVPLLKPNSRKKGTRIVKGLLGNLGLLRGSLDIVSMLISQSGLSVGTTVVA